MTKRGPPDFGVTESVLTIRLPRSLLKAMGDRARREGIKASEAWRRAARAWLGLKPDEYQRYLEERDE